MTIHLYGIPNCDTVKKARSWLDGQGLGYTFHDYKKEGADRAKLERWADRLGWEALLNRRGTTFRALDEADKADIDWAKAIALMLQHPSLIKRPVAESEDGGRLLVGFAANEWEKAWC
jgi:arsenate reductase (glutaredoxin)